MRHDEAIRQIITRCTANLRSIGDEDLARQIQMLPRVREAFADPFQSSPVQSNPERETTT